MPNDHIIENSFRPDILHRQESIFTIGNGYLGTRGTFSEGYPDEQAATFINGVYDDTPIYHTELVNTPNWLHLEIVVNGHTFRMDRGKVLESKRDLDLTKAVVSRQVVWQSDIGDTIEIQTERFASLANTHILALRGQIRSINYAGPIEIRAGIPGYVDNEGRGHWTWLDQGEASQQEIYLYLQTRISKIELCEAAFLQVQSAQEVTYQHWDTRWFPTITARTTIQPGETISIEKLVAVCTNRDTHDPRGALRKTLDVAMRSGYDKLVRQHSITWKNVWRHCQVEIEGDEEAHRAVRYNLFQLLCAAPRHDERVSIGAKGLSGFGYRGHIFWDTETFILPFFTFTQPKVARNLLLYRYHNLPGARRKAQKKGYDGALFPWESASKGDEVTPNWLPDGEDRVPIRIWTGDLEQHISADIAYAVYQYWQATGDDEFMRDYGAEMILETARFWNSRVERYPDSDQLGISNVIGPDEYHDHVIDNTYTNGMARWNLSAGLEIETWLEDQDIEKAAEINRRLEIDSDHLDQWQNLIDGLPLGYHPQSRLFEQFRGFFSLHDIRLNEFEPRNHSMQAILGVEGVQEYQVIEQPDVLMMLYLLRHAYDTRILKANYRYYSPRTDVHFGSPLAGPVQATLAAMLGETENAYRTFMRSALIDLHDLHGNTAEGLHAATAGGLWQAIVFGFGGLKFGPEGPSVHPHLPAAWQGLSFQVIYRGTPYEFELRRSRTVRPHHAARRKAEPQLPIRAAIFDLDGVLTDTSLYHFQAWKQLAEEEGIHFDPQLGEQLRGVSRRQSLLLLLGERKVTEQRIKEMMDRKDQYYRESINQLTPEDVLPGVIRMLQQARSAGIKIAIESGSHNARSVIERVGLTKYVDAIADGSSVTRLKPHPDLFLYTASMLDVPAETCVVFEDAEAGVQAALAAGMWTVGIGSEERFGAAHLVLPDLSKTTWKNLLKQLSLDPRPRPEEKSTNLSA